METTQNATFTYYDQKGRRLAAFCRFINPTEAEIFTLTCSHEDQFNKKYARMVYGDYLAGRDPLFEKHKPVIELITIQPEERELQTLLRFCHENYYFYLDAEISVQILVNINDLN